MMEENSLTFIPFDDPPKAVFERVVEDRFDGSDKTKVKGKIKIAVNSISLCKSLIIFRQCCQLPLHA